MARAASIFKAPIYDPWVLSVSLPIGAILFLLRTRRTNAEGEPAV